MLTTSSVLSVTFWLLTKLFALLFFLSIKFFKNKKQISTFSADEQLLTFKFDNH